MKLLRRAQAVVLDGIAAPRTRPSEGTEVEVKVNKGSVGILMRPEVASNSAALVKLVFAVKGLGAHDDEAIARTLTEAAGRSSDVVDWTENARQAFLSPSPRP